MTTSENVHISLSPAQVMQKRDNEKKAHSLRSVFEPYGRRATCTFEQPFEEKELDYFNRFKTPELRTMLSECDLPRRYANVPQRLRARLDPKNRECTAQKHLTKYDMIVVLKVSFCLVAIFQRRIKIFD